MASDADSARSRSPAASAIDPVRALGAGERSVLSLAFTTSASVLCVLDDAAVRTEARWLGLPVTGTLGVILRAKLRGEVPRATDLVREAVMAGLYLEGPG